MTDKKEASVFSGAELIRAASGTDRDVLSVVLDREKQYTRADAQRLYKAFLKGGSRNVLR